MSSKPAGTLRATANPRYVNLVELKHDRDSTSHGRSHRRGAREMTLSRVFRIARALGCRIAAIVSLLVVLGRSTPAHADNVDELIRQLETDGSDKVRLSAALNLTKLGDQRAILALAKAIANDGDKTVRGAAAVGLGELVTDKTKPSYKNLAIAALKRAAANDDSDLVRGQAEKALKAIGVAGPTPGPTPQQAGGGGIYVNIGPMSSKTGDSAVDSKLKALMVKVAMKTMSRVASGMATTWPGGVPTRAMLDAKGAAGFYIDGTLNELKVKESGSSSTVSCKINMLLASYPEKSIFGLLTGGASVQASASDLALAREDCVSAVVEDLIAKKIVPTINTKAGP
ncbi:MAG TPA: HEAT repeat domain-containing protein [Kofleriaceae bacterium]|nr:HEAT repeat domain-containing protein [Kofleriaceae bacterium]